MEFVLIVLALLFLALCVVLAFLSGYSLAVIKGFPLFRKTPPEPTEAEKRKLERQKRDDENFMSYDGSEQY